MGLTLLLIQLEHQLGLHDGSRAVRYFSLLPVLVGAAWLSPPLTLLLGALVLGTQQVEGLQHPQLANPEAALRLLGRLLVVNTCVWISLLRADLQARNRDMRLHLIHSLRASALAHEIRQPLAVIALKSRALMRLAEVEEATDPAWMETLDMLHEATGELDAITRAMGSLLRSVKTAQSPVDLADVLATTLTTLEADFRERRIRVRRVGLDRIWTVVGDGEQLRIACGNLLRNAVEALEMVDAAQRQLLVSLSHEHGRICLTVADSGPGLPEDLAHLLAQSSRKSSGMGVGLWIVNAIADHHGGHLQAIRHGALGGAELKLSLPDRR